MIALSSDCLLVQMTGGETIPLAADLIPAKLMGPSAARFDAEFLFNAAKAVFHYFQAELGRSLVTQEELTAAMEKALSGFKPCPPPVPKPEAPPVLESDLCRLAAEAEGGCELFFFPRLREEMRLQLQHAPRVLRFHGLRGCAMALAGARRWTPRCQNLSEQIVVFLRGCANVECSRLEFSLLIE